MNTKRTTPTKFWGMLKTYRGNVQPLLILRKYIPRLRERCRYIRYIIQVRIAVAGSNIRLGRCPTVCKECRLLSLICPYAPRRGSRRSNSTDKGGTPVNASGGCSVKTGPLCVATGQLTRRYEENSIRRRVIAMREHGEMSGGLFDRGTA